jgi:hypothetical protein
MFSSMNGVILYTLFRKLLFPLDIFWKLSVSVTETYFILLIAAHFILWIYHNLFILQMMNINVINNFLYYYVGINHHYIYNFTHLGISIRIPRIS